MIGALRGLVDSVNDETIVLDVSGVGYEVHATASVLREFGREGAQAKLVIYTDVKENSIQLYGFSNSLEKHVFLLLRKVKGIGSKTALSTLSALSAEEVLSSIGRADVSGLRRVPGVGAKTAERLIVELREAVGELTISEEPQRRPRSISSSISSNSLSHYGGGQFVGGPADDVVLALERLGFPAERARQVVTMTVERIQKETGSASPAVIETGELLRLALTNIQ